MKKQASLLLAGMLLITSLSACGESPEPNTGEENGEHSSITLRNYMALRQLILQIPMRRVYLPSTSKFMRGFML